jgi:hypothetical protein
MKPSFSFLFLLIFLPLLRASAAPLTLDLGNGLAYHRAQLIPADLPTSSPAKPQPLVLDLRYATGDSNAALALAAWLKFHAATRTPVFILANADTSPALRAAFADRDHSAGLIVLGVASADFEPDLALDVEPETERHAYDALENGTALATLIAPPLEKPRNDEARLVASRLPDRASKTGDDSEPPVTPPAASVASNAPATPPATPLIDVVLQRAVHLHRALLALKKL